MFFRNLTFFVFKNQTLFWILDAYGLLIIQTRLKLLQLNPCIMWTGHLEIYKNLF